MGIGKPCNGNGTGTGSRKTACYRTGTSAGQAGAEGRASGHPASGHPASAAGASAKKSQYLGTTHGDAKCLT